jgi:hypothetical protein
MNVSRPTAIEETFCGAMSLKKVIALSRNEAYRFHAALLEPLAKSVCQVEQTSREIVGGTSSIPGRGPGKP